MKILSCDVVQLFTLLFTVYCRLATICHAKQCNELNGGRIEIIAAAIIRIYNPGQSIVSDIVLPLK